MQGVSKTKFCKGTNIPKHSGNFSPWHARMMQYKNREYRIRIKDNMAIVGDKTDLSRLIPEQVIWLMINDPNFKEYRQEGEHTFGTKKYNAIRIITRNTIVGRFIGLPQSFTMREIIDTQGEFIYNFPDY